MTNGAHNKAILEPLLRAMQDFEAPQVQSLLQELMAHDAVAHMCLPFNDVTGPTALYETCYQPLLRAMPDLERRDFIILASPLQKGMNGWGAQAITLARLWLLGWIYPPQGI